MTAATLTQRIRADIEDKILSGAWAPGHRLPFEHELMASYGCARMTVSKALGSLADKGLIERRRRSGSIVRRQVVQAALLEIRDVQDEVLARGKAYAFELLSARTRAADRADRDRLDVDARTPLVALTCLHRADGRGFAVEDRLINLALVPQATSLATGDQPPGSWLLHHVPWSEARHEIAAEAAPSEVAANLDIAPGDACLTLQRWTWRGPDAVTQVKLTFPAASFHLTAHFTPWAGSRAGEGRWSNDRTANLGSAAETSRRG